MKKRLKIVLRQGFHIGEPGAEDDKEFLRECFVNLPEYDNISDLSSSKYILLGRTGSGKTAILSHIIEHKENSTVINPGDIAFDYVENSNLLSFLINNGANLNLLFQYMWKHVILSEIIRSYFNSLNKFESSISNFSKKNSHLIKYLRENSSEFWKDHDVVIKEISDSFSSQIQGDISSSINVPGVGSASSLSGRSTLDNEVKQKIEQRVKQYIGGLKIHEMNRSISIVNELMENKGKEIYVCIDDLDQEWVDKSIKYQMIESLIESVRSFGNIRNAKIIISLRTDIFDKVIKQSRNDGFQPEKLQGRVLRIIWKKNFMEDLLDRRVNKLFKSKYTREGVSYSDIFPEKYRKENFLKFLFDRTLNRPRDVIAFVNQILDEAASTTEVTARHISNAEAAYSRSRVESLNFEWRGMHPCLPSYIELLRKRVGTQSVLGFIGTEEIYNLYVELEGSKERNLECDDVYRSVEIFIENESVERRIIDISVAVVLVLYKVGAVEVKLRKGDAFMHSSLNDPLIDKTQFSDEAQFRVHPMLWRALAITPNL